MGILGHYPRARPALFDPPRVQGDRFTNFDMQMWVESILSGVGAIRPIHKFRHAGAGAD